MFIIENRYDEPESTKINVSDNIGKLAKVLVPYCDSQTLSEIGCAECPFYEDGWREKDLSMCMISNMGYGAPHNWAVYKDDEGGETNT